MRIHEIIKEQELEELNWADAKNKAKMTAAATALGIGALSSQMASDFMTPANASIISTKQNPAGDFINKVEKDAQVKHLGQLEGKELKQEFVKLILPMIKNNNQKILQERQKLLKILSNKNPSADEMDFLQNLMVKYKVKDNDLKELVKRVDIIPTGITLSQAALESGFGKSRMAQQGNALFGQKTTAKTDLRSETDAYAEFGNFENSIESYMRNLNTHEAYEEFRDQRANMRMHNKNLDPKSLTTTLLKYSTKGKKYVKQVKNIMLSNNFDELA